MFLLLNGSNITGVSSNVDELVAHIKNLHDSEKVKFETPNAVPSYTVNSYGNATNYAAQMIRNLKIIEVDGDRLLPSNNTPYIQLMDWQGNILVDGITDITSRYVTVEQTTYDGPQKVFATVIKKGLKSSGMNVIVDPNLVGRGVRTPEQYEELCGTFAKVKVTVNINANGWYGATLFMSADSLGDYRVETQQVAGSKATFAG